MSTLNDTIYKQIKYNNITDISREAQIIGNHFYIHFGMGLHYVDWRDIILDYFTGKSNRGDILSTVRCSLTMNLRDDDAENKDLMSRLVRDLRQLRKYVHGENKVSRDDGFEIDYLARTPGYYKVRAKHPDIPWIRVQFTIEKRNSKHWVICYMNKKTGRDEAQFSARQLKIAEEWVRKNAAEYVIKEGKNC